jgi:acyl dehydratase
MTDSFLEVGETASFSKTITETDLALFAGITGDFDPIHMNEEYAKASAFGRRLAHGGLVMGLLSSTASMMSRRSVERGSKAVSVSLGYDRVRFLRPVFIGDTLTVETKVLEARRSKSRPTVGIVLFEHVGTNQRGEVVCRAKRNAMIRARSEAG